MRVVLVGAGAVGAVYGWYLKKGGAHVTFVVRPKYVDSVRAGIRMWHGSREDMFAPDVVVSDIEDVRGQPIDQVWLCVPSTGFDEAGLQKIADATGDAIVVDLSPGLAGRSLRVFGRERLVDGLIPYIAYQTPLPGVAREAARAPGIAVWLPPFSATPLSGPRAEKARDALKAGGMSSKVVRDVGVSRGFGSALLMSIIARLELSGWSLREARRHLDGATGQALAAMGKKHNASPGMVGLLAIPFIARLVLFFAPMAAPLPLEPYLKFHFIKVGAQTREMMKGILAAADEAKLPAPELRALGAALLQKPVDPH